MPLLKGDQFHAYLTAQAQNAFPRISFFCCFLTYQAYQNSNAPFNLRLLLVYYYFISIFIVILLFIIIIVVIIIVYYCYYFYCFH